MVAEKLRETVLGEVGSGHARIFPIENKDTCRLIIFLIWNLQKNAFARLHLFNNEVDRDPHPSNLSLNQD